VVPDIPDFCSELVVLGPHGDAEGQPSDQARKAFAVHLRLCLTAEWVQTVNRHTYDGKAWQRG
jgi:hypothetical protein